MSKTTKVARAVKVACSKHDIYQRELAKGADIHRHTLFAIANGREPKLSTVIKIANYFGLTIDEFLALGDSEELAEVAKKLPVYDPLDALAAVMRKHDFSFGAQNVNPHNNANYAVYLKNKRVFTKKILNGPVIHDDIKPEQ
jgi:DNA-binding XRE family transcriptional regulator